MRVGDLNFAMSISGASSVENATEGVARSMEDVEEATKEASASQTRVQNELRETGEAAERAAQSQKEFSGTNGLASNTLTSLSDGLADAQFGLSGAANNASFAAESFAGLAAKTGGTVAAFKALGSSLSGPLGILFAFQTLVALAPQIISFFSDTEEAAKGTKDEIKELADSVGSFAENIRSAGQTDQVVSRLQDIRNQLSRGIFGGFTDAFEEFGITSVKEASKVRTALDALIGRLQTDPQEEEFFTALTDLRVPPQIAQELTDIAIAADKADEETDEFSLPSVDGTGNAGIVEAPNRPEPIAPSDVIDTRVFQSLDQVQRELGEGLVDSVNEADQALSFLRQEFNAATSQEQRTRIQALIGRVKGLKREFNQTGNQTQRLQLLGNQAQAALQHGFLSVGDSLGSVIGGLASGEQAFRSFADVGQRVIQQLISKLTGLITKLLIIQPLISALGLGTGGVGLALPSVTGLFGGGIGRVGGSAVTSRAGGNLNASISMDELAFQLDRSLKSKGQAGILK